ncbi:hypothetical protein OIO90_002035 [Microbotryomycetes sp. JL221]|nr:hypothetical protein OIO90_002035 [Microbotryomycetes sp. JL221]
MSSVVNQTKEAQTPLSQLISTRLDCPPELKRLRTRHRPSSLSTTSTMSTLEQHDLRRIGKRRSRPSCLFTYSCQPTTSMRFDPCRRLLPALDLVQDDSTKKNTLNEPRSTPMVRTPGIMNMNLFTRMAIDEQQDQQVRLKIRRQQQQSYSAHTSSAVEWSRADPSQVHPEHLERSSEQTIETRQRVSSAVESDSESEQESTSTTVSQLSLFPTCPTRSTITKRVPLSPTTQQKFASMQLTSISKDNKFPTRRESMTQLVTSSSTTTSSTNQTRKRRFNTFACLKRFDQRQDQSIETVVGTETEMENMDLVRRRPSLVFAC